MKHQKRFLSSIVCVVFSFFLFLNSCSSSDHSGSDTPDTETVQAAFDSFLEEVFCQEISSNTINLHFTLAHPEHAGIAEYEVTLGDLSEKALAESNARVENYLETLNQFSSDDLPLPMQVTYDVLKDYFTTMLDMAPLTLYDEPLSPSSGIQAQLPMLYEEYVFYDKTDVEDYLTLLSQTKDYFAQIIEFEKRKADAGLFMPDYSCNSIISQCNDFIKDADNHFLIETFEKRIEKLSNLSQEERDSYIAKNEKLVKEDLVAAYEFLAQEMTALLGSGKNEQGLCYFPEGKDYYEFLVSFSSGSSDTISEIQSRITEERTAALTECMELSKQDADLWNKCAKTTLMSKSPAAALDELQQDMLESFPVPPATAYTVNYIDENIADYVAPAYYITPPIDDYTNNSIYINAEIDTTDIEYFTTLAHEGFPGHLYQTVMSYESDIPSVRNLVPCSGYVEGWATYVEMLSYHYADIEPAVATYLSNNRSSLLSLYASTDIGIHYDGWNLEQTKEFWNSYGITDHAIIEEIYEYIVGEPGNYLQYYVGYLEFLDLKEQAISKYGDAFDEIAYHEALLSIGPAPFAIIEEYLDDYYQP